MNGYHVRNAANVSRISSWFSGERHAIAHNDDGPPEPVPDPERLAELRASVAIYQPPSPSPTYITEAEAKRIANVPEGAKYALRFVPYAAVEQIHRPLHGNALVPPDRMVWIVAVAAETMTRGSPRFPSGRTHGYSVVIDGETGHAFSHGSGVLALDVDDSACHINWATDVARAQVPALRRWPNFNADSSNR